MTLFLVVMLLLIQNIHQSLKDDLSFCAREISLLLRMQNYFFFLEVNLYHYSAVKISAVANNSKIKHINQIFIHIKTPIISLSVKVIS